MRLHGKSGTGRIGTKTMATTNTEHHAQLARLRAAAVNYRKCLREIGSILNALETAGAPVDMYRREILLYEYSISMATSRVAMRWASGELGDNGIANELVGKIPHSRLADMTLATIERVTIGKHTIVSPVEKRVVTKTFNQMTRDEVSRNIDKQGFRPIAKSAQQVPEFRSCKAAEVRLHRDGVVFVSKGYEPIHMTVSRVLLTKALEQDSPPKEGAA